MLRVEISSRYGARLLTDRSYRRGQWIYRISRYRVWEHPTQRTVQVGPEAHLEESGVLVYLNHSCRPNTRLDVEHLTLVAERDLAAGEELTYFYPSTEWEMAEPFPCLCGAPECLGYIAGARQVAPEKLQGYFLNPHIRLLLAASLRVAATG